MERAIELSLEGMRAGAGGPFGAVIVKDGKVISEGYNQVLGTNDPTAHAEITAIRKACEVVGSFDLSGCEIYTSCEPCPMCLSAIYWARLDKIFYANSRDDAAAIGFDDEFLYREVATDLPDRSLPTQRIMSEEAKSAFEEWDDKEDKTSY